MGEDVLRVCWDAAAVVRTPGFSHPQNAPLRASRLTTSYCPAPDRIYSGQIFNNELTHDPRKRIDTRDVARSVAYCKLSKLLDSTRELRKGQSTGRGRFRRRLNQVLQAVDNHAVVGDILIQGQGGTAALVWSSIRLLLRVVCAEIECGEECGEALIIISDSIERWEKQLQLFPTNQAIFASVSKLFARILNYLVRATLQLSSSYPARTAWAAFGGTPKFRRIIASIQRCAGSLDRSRQFEELESIVHWLQTASTLKLPVQPMKWEPGTCQWIYKDKAYQLWEQSGYQHCLWIQGITGCGKTVLARFLAENAKTELVLSHYFRDSLGVSSVQAVSFTISLLVCLCRDEAVITNPRFKGVIDIIRSLSAVAKAGREYVLEQLLDVLDSIFTEVPDTTIIVDALDECSDVLDGNTRRLFDYLSSLADRRKVRVIVLSRYHTNIEASFQDAYKLKMDKTKIEPDIRHFVKARIRKNPSLQMLQNQILEKVSAGCQEMFLWVRLMLDGIEKVDTLNEQLEVIKTFPPDLFRAFDQLFSQTSQGFTPTQEKYQFEMFMLLVASIRPLTPEEISALIAVDSLIHSLGEHDKFSDPYATVQKLGGPFVTITEGRAQIAHASMKEFLLRGHLTLNDSDVYLTDKCLSTLSQAKYSTWQYSAYWLRKNLISAGMVVATKIRDKEDPVPYDYAAVHWQDHLVRLSKPSDTIVKKFNLFITGNAAVAWSERLVDISGGGVANIPAQVNVLATLSTWAKLLPPPIKRTLLLDEFFVTAHENLGRELADKGGDRELDYLPAVRLGQFFNIGGKSYAEFRKAFEYDKIVVDGFTKVFGPRNPHTLRARTTMINDYFFQELIEEADRELTEVAAIQLEVRGPDHTDYLNTVQLLGTAKYALTKFDEAFAMLDISGEGLLKLHGDRSRAYLMNLLWKGEVVEQQKGKLDDARELYETALTTWEAIMGKKHPLSLMLQTAVSSVYRKQRNYELAEATLVEAWGERLRLFSLNSNTTVDTGIQLAITYREKRKGNEALELLDVIKKSTVFEDDFERVSQIVHIKALVEFDRGKFDEPRLELTKVIDKSTGSSRDRNNREALWVRATLASALRQHGDDDEALMLFSELVRPMDKSTNFRPNTPTLRDEPEPPAQLKLAEEALMLVKGADPKAADKLLEDNNLQWVRPKDFWIRQGGPIADTAVMEPVKLTPKWLHPSP